MNSVSDTSFFPFAGLIQSAVFIVLVLSAVFESDFGCGSEAILARRRNGDDQSKQSGHRDRTTRIAFGNDAWLNFLHDDQSSIRPESFRGSSYYRRRLISTHKG